VQVQRHLLLGDRGAQPLDLLFGFCQGSLLAGRARAAGHRRGQRVQRPLLRGAADVHYRRAVHPRFAAASRCVACPVSTDTDISSFSLGASRRRVLREFMIRSDVMISLPAGQVRRPMPGYLQDRMVQELRRKQFGQAWSEAAVGLELATAGGVHRAGSGAVRRAAPGQSDRDWPNAMSRLRAGRCWTTRGWPSG
jgi:hypothetical protein